MASLNKVLLIGRLGADPELNYTQQGNAICRFSVATDESYKDRDGQWQTKTEWHRVVLWGKNAENAGEILRKGSLVFIEGKNTTRSWEDKESGERKYITEVNGAMFRAISNYGRENGDAGSGGSPPPPPDDDDVPF